MNNNKSIFHQNRTKLLDNMFSTMPIIKENENVTLYYNGEFYINRNHNNSLIIYSMTLTKANEYFNAQ